MKSVGITTVLAFCAGVLLVSSPAYAWTCTATNARGVNYTAVGAVRATVASRALVKCQVNSARPGTCYIKSCTLP